MLDLAQDMHFANHMLRRDLRAAVYRRVCSDLYALQWLRRSVEAMSVHRPLTPEQEARKEWGRHFDASGPTPAIALLIALFKALTVNENG